MCISLDRMDVLSTRPSFTRFYLFRQKPSSLKIEKNVKILKHIIIDLSTFRHNKEIVEELIFRCNVVRFLKLNLVSLWLGQHNKINILASAL